MSSVIFTYTTQDKFAAKKGRGSQWLRKFLQLINQRYVQTCGVLEVNNEVARNRTQGWVDGLQIEASDALDVQKEEFDIRATCSSPIPLDEDHWHYHRFMDGYIIMKNNEFERFVDVKNINTNKLHRCDHQKCSFYNRSETFASFSKECNVLDSPRTRRTIDILNDMI